MWLGGISCQSVWGVIFQWGSTQKVSTELPATSRHRWRLLKATLSPDQQTNKQELMCLWSSWSASPAIIDPEWAMALNPSATPSRLSPCVSNTSCSFFRPLKLIKNVCQFEGNNSKPFSQSELSSAISTTSQTSPAEPGYTLPLQTV